MTDPTSDRAVQKRRQLARVARLKRRTAAASMLAFAALFALAAQHVVKAASGRAASVQPPRLSATVTSAKFFDEKSAFAFGTYPGLGAPAAPQSQSSPAPPVAQSSVS